MSQAEIPKLNVGDWINVKFINANEAAKDPK